MHLMFSEWIVDERTRLIPEERFFKRNGAKKDRDTWHSKDKPEEVREKWVAMMNGAMERAGIEQHLDARSWAERGRRILRLSLNRRCLAEMVGAVELREKVEDLRQKREELPASYLNQEAAAEQIERLAEAEVQRIRERARRTARNLDKLIEKAGELAAEVKERTVAAARNVPERVESFFGGGERGKAAESELAQKQASPPPFSAEELMEQKLAALDRQMALQETMDAKLAALDKRMEAEAKAQQEKERSREQELSKQQVRSRGFEIER